VNTPIITD